MTFKIEAKLLSVYNCDGMDLTDKFSGKDEAKVKDSIDNKLESMSARIEQLASQIMVIQKTVNNMELRINEEEKGHGKRGFECPQ